MISTLNWIVFVIISLHFRTQNALPVTSCKSCKYAAELLPNYNEQSNNDIQKPKVIKCKTGYALSGVSCSNVKGGAMCPSGYLCVDQTSTSAICCPESQEELWKPSDPKITRQQYMERLGLKKSHFNYVSRKIKKLKKRLASRFGKTIEDPDSLSILIDDILLMPDQVFFLMEHYSEYLERIRVKRKIQNFETLPTRKWNMPVPIKIDSNFDIDAQTQILAALAHWQEHTCIRFERLPLDAEMVESHILYTNESGCVSTIGRSTFTIPQLIKLGDGCTTTLGTPVHETGHTLGLFHEHMRPDRDHNVMVLFDNIIPDAMANFLVEGEDRVNSYGVPYDYGSVMHYGNNFFSIDRDNLNTIEPLGPLYSSGMGQRSALSFYDIKIANLAYCTDTCPEPLPCLRGGITNPNDCDSCICPDGFGGRLCETVAASDVGCIPRRDESIFVNSVEEQCVHSPNYGRGSYDPFSQCNWHLLAPEGQRIEVYFDGDFHVYCRSKKCYHWIEVMYKGDLLEPGPRFCCYERPEAQLVSELNEVMVAFRSLYSSDYTTDFRRQGFNLCYRLYNEVDDCADGPCVNGGECRDIGDGYQCDCPLRFTGNNCEAEIPIDFCQDQLCFNGGTCMSVHMDFDCVCVEGYTGRNCEHVIDHCHPNPCMNGGVCENLIGIGFWCQCPVTHEGNTCEIPIGVCLRGWTQRDQSCYQYFYCDSCSLSWQSARAACQAVDADLVGIESDEEQEWITHWLSDTYNAGIYDETPHTQTWIGGWYDRRWTWISSGDVIGCGRSYWGYRGCLSNDLGDCLAFSTSHLYYSDWYDYPCRYSRPYICEKSSGDGTPGDPCSHSPCENGGECIPGPQPGDYTCNCPPGFIGPNCETVHCGDDWVRYEEHCYKFFDNFVGWESANRMCVEQGSYLATIETDGEQEWLEEWLRSAYNAGIYRQTPHTQMWIGGQYSERARWEWYINNSPIGCHRSYWGSRGCESDSLGPCLAFSISHLYYGKWYDYPCAYERPYLCERTMDEEQNDEIPDLTDECSSDPCQNEGTCIDEGLTYRCECTENWLGTNCGILNKELVQYCDSEPCKNSGTCEELENTYRCHCVPPYAGSNCDMEWTRPMSSKYCYMYMADFLDFSTANQTCENINGNLAVLDDENENMKIAKWLHHICDAGVYGKTPHTQMWIGAVYDEDAFKWITTKEKLNCSSSSWGKRGCHSSKYGSCLAFSMSYNYYGKWYDYECDYTRPYLCQHQTQDVNACVEVIIDSEEEDFCVDKPCGQYGTCVSTKTSFICKCDDGWAGTNCEIDLIDNCHGRECLNNGTCIDGVDTFMCKCPNGLGGVYCELDVYNDCENDPCRHGGTCSDQGTSFVCECPPGWGGELCEYDKSDPCSDDSLCANGGTCISYEEDNGEFDCQCAEFWTGRLCEIREIVEDCTTKGCYNGGSCLLDGDSYTCHCIGDWTGKFCDQSINDICYPNPCDNDGHCYKNGDMFLCFCEEGWKGDLCQERDVASCDPNPCENEGVCFSGGDGSYICRCRDGWTGSLCEHANRCASGPCQHGAVCTSRNDSYYCNCPHGWSGINCEVDVHNNCQADSCQNGGTCVDGVHTFSCECPDGWTGFHCEMDNKDNCAENPCNNRGICVDGPGSFTCKCFPGWGGDICDVDIEDNCSPNSCHNGGTCSDGAGSFSCRCPAVWGGDRCQIDIEDNCDQDPEPCLNGATCIDGPGDYTCKCDSGWGGPRCHVDIVNDCQSDSCKNGGFCRDGVNTVSCVCPDEWGGPTCEEDIEDNCGIQPCLNLADCIDGVHSYECICEEGWSGINCEISNAEPCDSDPCKNDGRCENMDDGTALCHCDFPYVGQFCEIVWSKAPGGENCWAFVPLMQPFEEAKDTCIQLGGMLAGKPPDEESGVNRDTSSGPGVDEYKWIMDWLQIYFDAGKDGLTPQQQAWMGGQYINGTFKWIPANEEIECDSQQWRPPLTGCQMTDVGLCLALSISHIDYGKWYNYNCAAVRPFLCRKNDDGRCKELTDVPVSYNTDQCTDSPCQNGGTCQINENNERWCQCAERWMGENCEVQIIWSKAPGGENCWAFVPLMQPFEEAKDTCIQLGGMLAGKPPDEESGVNRDTSSGPGVDEYKWIMDWLQIYFDAGKDGLTIQEQAWMGGQYINATFKWIPANEEIKCDMEQWRTPLTGCQMTDVGLCLALSISHIDYGKWYSYNCAADRPFLCRKNDDGLCTELTDVPVSLNTNQCSDSPCENGGTCQINEKNERWCQCVDGWTGENCQLQLIWKKNPNSNLCYSFINENVDFLTAKSRCESLYGDTSLAYITTDEANAFLREWLQADYSAGIYQQTPHTQMWVGGQYDENKNAFVWLGFGSDIIDCSLSSWGDRGCQSKSVGDCLAFSLSHIAYGQWFDYTCTFQRPYLCLANTYGVCPGDNNGKDTR